MSLGSLYRKALKFPRIGSTKLELYFQLMPKSSYITNLGQ